MHTALDEKLARYRELEQQWYDPATAADPVRAAAVARERGALAKIVEPYLELQRLDAAIQEAQTLAAQEEDAELRALAEEELAALRQRREKVWQRLEEELLIDPAEDFSRVIMEIRAGEGGDEAALFAADLFRMYSRYVRDVHSLRSFQRLDRRGYCSPTGGCGRIQGSDLCYRGRERLPLSAA